MYVSTAGCGTGLGDCGCGGTCGAGPLGLGADAGDLYNKWMQTAIPGEQRRVTRRTDYLYNNLTPAQFAKVYGAEENWYNRYAQRTGVSGLGLFDSMDFTTWGWMEWGTVFVGVYFVGSLLGDIGSARRRVRGSFSRRRSSAKKRGQLEESIRKKKRELSLI